VVLKAGDRVTVIDQAGSRVLAGPGSFKLDSAVNRDAGGNTALASLIARGGARTRTGAVRGDAAAPPVEAAAPDNVWYVDVSRGGTVCIADPAQVVLWRPNRAETGSATLFGADGTSAEVTFRAGSAIKLWPVASRSPRGCWRRCPKTRSRSPRCWRRRAARRSSMCWPLRGRARRNKVSRPMP
jgi:hypothetical protein